jgi:hypothetical protein
MIRQAFSVSVLALATLAGNPVQAQGEIWMCVDEHGNRTFTNLGDTKRCKKLDVQPVMTVPATKSSGKAAGGSAASAPTPSDFPKVDPATQKNRDATRRQLLEDELKKEERTLAELEKTYNNGEPERQGNEKNYQKYLDRVQQLKDDIARTRNNIAEIKRELGTVRN